MDGNGRWAQGRGLPRTEGHGAGEAALIDATYGALSIGVPGTVAGLALAQRKYGSGKLSLADLIAPAIELATKGFPVEDDTADSLPRARE